MSVYVGDLTGCEYTKDWPYLQKAVMVADDLDELLDLAARCGISKNKLRTVDGIPQFWLTMFMTELALARGAVLASLEKDNHANCLHWWQMLGGKT